VTRQRHPWPEATLWALTAGTFFILTYRAANWLAAQRAGVPSIVFAWERHIPFVAWTIIPYWSTDLLFAFSFFICSTRREVQLHAKRLIAAQILCVAVFLWFPLCYSVEHPVPAAPFNFFFRVLGSFDMPFNQAPSLHLAITTVLWVKYSEHTRGLTRLLLRIWLVMTGASTLTTYQHHFIDLPTGVWVGLFCLVLFPERGWEPKIAMQGRGLALSVLYGVGSMSLIITSVWLGGPAWLLLWPAGALLVMALAYGIGSPHLLRSGSGKMSFATAVLLAPYLAAAKVNSWCWGRNLLPKAVVATASYAGLREGELRGLEWPDYTGNALNVNRSIWKDVVNLPKTRASAAPVPVIRQLADILNGYQSSMGNPKTGVIFHLGDGIPMDFDKMAQRVIRPVVEAIGMVWYGWHGFRRGIASNLYELGANEKIVQRVLRHAKPHVTKDRYIKAFDPAVIAAMKTLEATLDTLKQSAAIVQQMN
jgi:hypothetical protein